MPEHPPKAALAAAALALALSACGAGSTPSEAGSSEVAPPSTAEAAEAAPATTAAAAEATAADDADTEQAPAASGVNNFPDVTVTDVSSGEPFNLRSLADSGTPVALWFYYPH